MKRIVAAPTAGACGVVPAVYLTLQEQRQIDDERMLEAMYIASGVGRCHCKPCIFLRVRQEAVRQRLSASSMAAAGAVTLQDGDSEAIDPCSSYGNGKKFCLALHVIL